MKAGFREGDVIVEIDGRSERISDSQWIAQAVNKYRRGDRIAVAVLRGKERVALRLPIQ